MRKTMLAALVALCFVAGAPQAADTPEPRARVDVGAGLSLSTAEYDGQSDFGQGMGVTLGVLFKNGFLLRFDLGRFGTKDTELADFGFGTEPLTLDSTYYPADATAGYLWNRSGSVRPYIRAGFALVGVEVDVDSSSSGPFELVSDHDQGLTIGGGVELGNGPHLFAMDYHVVPGLEVDSGAFGVSTGSLEFDYRELRFDYRYRF